MNVLRFGSNNSADVLMRVWFDPTVKDLTKLSRKLLTVLKFLRPILDEPSTRITISAGVSHVKISTKEKHILLFCQKFYSHLGASIQHFLT